MRAHRRTGSQQLGLGEDEGTCRQEEHEQQNEETGEEWFGSNSANELRSDLGGGDEEWLEQADKGLK